MKLLDEYFEIEKKIYEYFGYQECWTQFPLSDDTDYYWKLNQNSVSFGETIGDVDNDDGFENEFYGWNRPTVYRQEDYTMICVDTHCDGNKFLAVFDNAKEIK
jgi:hypothetical protein